MRIAKVFDLFEFEHVNQKAIDIESGRDFRFAKKIMPQLFSHATAVKKDARSRGSKPCVFRVWIAHG
jgi:hypothetical protein